MTKIYCPPSKKTIKNKIFKFELDESDSIPQPIVFCPFFNGELCTGSAVEQSFCIGKCTYCELDSEYDDWI